MKKIFILLAIILSTINLMLSSCGNPNDSIAQKESKETSENDNKSIAKQAVLLENKDVKSKTIENMQVVYKGEITATAKYAAYAKKAKQEGYSQIALLYKAVSIAENIHAHNHQAVLQEAGAIVPLIKPIYTVKLTKENLKDDIEGEAYEASTMYPEFLKTAEKADNQLALISLAYAMKTEKKHNVMYKKALSALQNNSINTLPSVFYVCPTCGNTYETKAPMRCSFSMTKGEKFIKINRL